MCHYSTVDVAVAVVVVEVAVADGVADAGVADAGVAAAVPCLVLEPCTWLDWAELGIAEKVFH